MLFCLLSFEQEGHLLLRTAQYRRAMTRQAHVKIKVCQVCNGTKGICITCAAKALRQMKTFCSAHRIAHKQQLFIFMIKAQASGGMAGSCDHLYPARAVYNLSALARHINCCRLVFKNKGLHKKKYGFKDL